MISLRLFNYTVVFLYIGLYIAAHQSLAINYLTIAQDIKSYKKEEYPSCFVHFLVDSAGKKYVVKQIKFDDNLSRLAKLVGEIVALYIGHAIGVPLNSACIIPAGVPFTGKKTALPATLHTHVLGTRFDKFLLAHKRHSYIGLDIHQKDPRGLSIRVIRNMARHKDFPAMVALDTFVGNADRGPNNFFYDEKTNSFYGIDMAGSFFRNLCQPSVANMHKLLADQRLQFSSREKKGLLKYYKTLQKLVDRFDPELLSSKIQEYAEHAGFFGETFFDCKVQAKCIRFLDKCKRITHKSYQDAIELIRVLGQLLAKHGIT